MMNPWYPDYSGSMPYIGYALENPGASEPIYPIRTRKARRKSRIVKRRRGFPRGAWGGAWGGAWVYRITRGAGT